MFDILMQRHWIRSLSVTFQFVAVFLLKKLANIYIVCLCVCLSVCQDMYIYVSIRLSVLTFTRKETYMCMFRQTDGYMCMFRQTDG